MELQSHKNLRDNILMKMLLSLPQTGIYSRENHFLPLDWSDMIFVCIQASWLNSEKVNSKLSKSYSQVFRKVLIIPLQNQ